MERFQRRLEVDVQPCESTLERGCDRFVQQRGTDPASLVIAMDGGVEQEAVNAAVPHDIHEADELRAVECAMYTRLRSSTAAKSRGACAVQAVAKSSFSASPASGGERR